MTQFKLTIDVDNDDFQTFREPAVAAILRQVADDLEAGEKDFDRYQTLLDGNGNDCGRAAFKL